MLTLSPAARHVAAKCTVTSRMNGPIDDRGGPGARALAPTTARAGRRAGVPRRPMDRDPERSGQTRGVCTEGPAQAGVHTAPHAAGKQPALAGAKAGGRGANGLTAQRGRTGSRTKGQRFTGWRILTALEALPRGKRFAAFSFLPDLGFCR